MLFHILYGFCPVCLGDNEQFLSHLGVIREVFAYPELTVSAFIAIGCVPVGNTPLESFS
ncbi:hypothetical protein ES703_105868 [subsurface metagenome]